MFHSIRRPFAIAAVAALSMVLSAGPAHAAPGAQDSRLVVLTPVGYGVGPSIARSPVSDRRGEQTREQPLLLTNGSGHGKPGGGGGGGGSDGALQSSATTPLGTIAGTGFDGVGVGMGAYSPCCAPPDTNASVGATEVVQWVNLDYAVFSKATGALLQGPTAGNTFWNGFTAGNCSTNNDGDPIIKFDAQAQRWFATQFSVTGGPPYFQCIAVSSGPDFMTSTWHQYAYSFGTSFPDYPKLGVWPDAYYMSFNRFLNGVSFQGAAACAFDRAAMLAGTAASAQCFNLGTGVASLLPADLDGATGALGSTALPPSGAPNVFANFGTNALNLSKFHVDFANSANSTFTTSSLAVPAFSTACGGGSCIAQPGTNNQLDSLGDRLMYRLAYRNFGDHETLVVTHSVQGSGTAAPRWYELRSPGTQTFSVYQASSYAPDATYRWMGSAAMDKLGDLAIGYSASSSAVSPAIRYSGRLAADPLNQLRSEETIQAGGGSQTGTLHRWGDYSSMALDPFDDCTFWYTTEYLKASGSFNWSTHLFSFKFPGCQ